MRAANWGSAKVGKGLSTAFASVAVVSVAVVSVAPVSTGFVSTGWVGRGAALPKFGPTGGFSSASTSPVVDAAAISSAGADLATPEVVMMVAPTFVGLSSATVAAALAALTVALAAPSLKSNIAAFFASSAVSRSSRMGSSRAERISV